MGRVKDLTIDKMDEYYATQQADEPVYEKTYKESLLQVAIERDFYKARFEWERARVYKAWKDDPWARRRLAYKRRWKQ
jgi:hypothetical protein